jgi:WD40 repeat protein
MRSAVFRIFLSSTFGDFQAEREALRAEVWPRLERYCGARGASFEVVDLRWGVSEADGLSHDTLRICLDEVAHCQKLSPKPNFLMLLGDRYGWRPLPTEIPVEEFDAIFAELAGDGEQCDLLNRWYRRDDNAIPPHYRLLPKDASQLVGWADAEGKLIALLRSAAQTLGVTKERRERYFLSATHLEIVRGTLAVADADDHIFAFFRKIEGLDAAGSAAARFTDQTGGQPDLEASRFRAELRDEIAAVIPAEHCFTYPCRWTGQPDAPISTEHIAAFCADIEHSLNELIDREFQAVTGDALDQEAERHLGFAEDKASTFMGRTTEIEQVLAWAEQALAADDRVQDAAVEIEDGDDEADEDGEQAAPPGAPPLIVHGPGGVGKSAFMAKATADLEAQHPGAVVIRRFIGAAPRSIDLYSFLGDLLREIARRYEQPEALPEGNLKVLIDELPARLAWASADMPLILAIDALDQFNASFEARQHQWLPRQLPPHVALLLSVLDGDVMEAASRRFSEAGTLRLPVFSREDGGLLLDAMLRAGEDIAPQRKRRLTDEQRRTVLDAFDQDGRPLYLALTASIVRRWTSWHAAEVLPGSIETLIEDIIRRLHTTHGERIADRALDYLVASRFGVSDEEMRDLLWQDPDARADFDLRKNKDQPEVTALPPVIWSRIYFELAPYLTAQSIDGALLHRFFHRIIGEEVARLSLADDKALVHSRIADYFAQQPLYLGDDANKSPNLRKLMEEPWQRIQAGQLDKAEALLTNFDFAITKCQANRFDDLYDDFQRLAQGVRQSGAALSKNMAIWDEFIRTKAHILRRGDDAWPSHKILLQLAIEHADDSPLTLAAEDFVQQGRCNWAWLKCATRRERYFPNSCLVVLEGHTYAVFGAQILADGRVLSWSGDHSLRLWDGMTGAPLAVLEGHTGLVCGAQALADDCLLSWSNDGTLRLWDGMTGAPLAVLEGHTSSVNGLQVLADGRLLSWSSDGTLRLWKGTTGVPLAVLADHTASVDGVQVLADDRLLSWSDDGALRLWDGTTGAPLAVLVGHTEKVRGAQVLADGRLLSWSKDGTLRLWDGTTGVPLAVLADHTASVDGVQVLADGRLLSWSDDGTLRLWAGTTGAPLAVLDGHTASVIGVQVLADGRLLSWDEDRTLRLWDGTTGAPLVVLEGHPYAVFGVQVLADGRLLSWDWKGTLRLWDGTTGVPLAVLEGHTRWVKGVQALADGRLLSWSADGTLRLWDGTTGVPLAVLEDHTQLVDEVQVLADGRVLSWSGDHSLRLWDGMTGAPLAVLAGHTEWVVGAQILADGRVLSWSGDHSLRLWDGMTGAPLAVLEGHTASVRRVQVLADGRLLSWCGDHTLRLWDSTTGAPLAVLEGHTEWVNGAQVLADGRVLSWSSDDTLRLWDGMTGAPLTVLEGHTEWVDGAQVLAEGRLLSWSGDHTLRLWDGMTGAPLTVLEGHTALFSGVQVLVDGRLLSWSYDGTLRLWDGMTGASLAMLAGHTNTVDGVQVLADGRLLSWSSDGTLRLWDGTTGSALAMLAGHTASVDGVQVLADGRLLSWSGREVLLRKESGIVEGRLSTGGNDICSSFEDLAVMAPNLSGKASDGTTAWVRTDRLAWVSNGSRFPQALQWHTDAGGLKAVHSISTSNCIIQTSRELNVLELMR